MTLKEFFDGKSNHLTSAVAARLDELFGEDCAEDGRAEGKFSQMVENIRNESRLAGEAWEAFCQAVTTCDDDTNSICDAITEWARNAWQTGQWAAISGFQGPVAGTQQNCIFAHCSILAWLRDYLAYHWAVSPEEAERELLAVIDEDDIEAQRAKLAGTRLKAYDVMWATFNHDDQDGDPLDYLPHTAQGILASLGMTGWDKTDAIVVFHYLLDDNHRPYIPTILEACSSDNWNVFWRVNTDKGTVICGWTYPRPGHEDKGTRKCPEVVHEPIFGDTISKCPVHFPPLA